MYSVLENNLSVLLEKLTQTVVTVIVCNSIASKLLIHWWMFSYF